MELSPPVSRLTGAAADPIDRTCIQAYLQDFPVTEPPKCVILIPAYNEEESLPSVLARMPTALINSRPRVIVISDGSTDRSAEVAIDSGYTACSTPINRGQGAALRLGYQLAIALGADYVGIVDADGQWDPLDLNTAFELLEDRTASFVQGSRVLGSTQVGDHFRDLGVAVFARLISLLVRQRVTDTSSGLRALRVDLFDRIRLEQPQYQASELLIAAALNGATIKEFPVDMSPRTAGHSKKAHNILYGGHFLKAALRTWIRERWISAQ
ncbi:MAG: glycosyltransferase family 2 protein [Ferrimicrobium sp.]